MSVQIGRFHVLAPEIYLFGPTFEPKRYIIMGMRMFLRTSLVVVLLAVIASLTLRLASAGGRPVVVPDPQLDAPLAPGAESTAVIAGGCFWGIQAVYQHVKGV